MLIGIDPVLGPDCLALLRAMRHGDEPDPLVAMRPAGEGDRPAVIADMQRVVDRRTAGRFTLALLDRFAFDERARAAFGVIATGERRGAQAARTQGARPALG